MHFAIALKEHGLLYLTESPRAPLREWSVLFTLSLPMVWVAYCALLLDSRVFKVGLIPNLKIVKYKITYFPTFVNV